MDFVLNQGQVHCIRSYKHFIRGILQDFQCRFVRKAILILALYPLQYPG